jgi:hypothetical protein
MVSASTLIFCVELPSRLFYLQGTSIFLLTYTRAATSSLTLGAKLWHNLCAHAAIAMPHVTASSCLVIRGYPLPPALALLETPPKRHFPSAMPPTVRVFADTTPYQPYRALFRLSQALSSRVSPPLPSPSPPTRPRPPHQLPLMHSGAYTRADARTRCCAMLAVSSGCIPRVTCLLAQPRISRCLPAPLYPLVHARAPLLATHAHQKLASCAHAAGPRRVDALVQPPGQPPGDPPRLHRPCAYPCT